MHFFSSSWCVHAAEFSHDREIMLNVDAVEAHPEELRVFSTALSLASQLETSTVSLRNKLQLAVAA